MFQLTPFAISGMFIVLALSPIIYLLYRQGKTKLTYVLNIHLLTVWIWGMGAILIGINKNPNLSFSIQDFAGTGVIFMPSTLYHSICLLRDKTNRIFFIFCYLQSVIFTYFLWTHQMFTYPKFMFNSLYIPQGGYIYFSCYILWLFIIAISNLILLIFYIKTDPKNKQQIFLMVMAIPIVFGIGSINFIPYFGISIYPYCNFFVPLYAFFLIYAILKFEFLDIRLVIKKSAFYSLIATVVTLVYFFIIILLEKYAQGILGYKSLSFSIIAALFISIIFVPFRNKLQSYVDKHFFHSTTQEIALQNQKLRTEIIESEKYKTLGILASGIAHEIKNPLTAIYTFSQELPKRLDDKKFLSNFAPLVRNEVERINDLVHQLLDYSKPQAPKLEPTDIHKLIADTLDFLSSQALSKQINVIKKFGAPEDIQILIDSQQIRQVLLNLIINAMDAVDKKGVLTMGTALHEIKNENSQAGQRLFIISIQDNGCGIAPEDLPHIFDPFFSRKDKSTGLGLAITQSIIENHGGAIKVASQVGVGTEMIIELPIT